MKLRHWVVNRRGIWRGGHGGREDGEKGWGRKEFPMKSLPWWPMGQEEAIGYGEEGKGRLMRFLHTKIEVTRWNQQNCALGWHTASAGVPMVFSSLSNSQYFPSSLTLFSLSQASREWSLCIGVLCRGSIPVYLDSLPELPQWWPVLLCRRGLLHFPFSFMCMCLCLHSVCVCTHIRSESAWIVVVQSTESWSHRGILVTGRVLTGTPTSVHSLRIRVRNVILLVPWEYIHLSLTWLTETNKYKAEYWGYVGKYTYELETHTEMNRDEVSWVCHLL